LRHVDMWSRCRR